MDEEEIGFGAENLAQFTFNKIILWVGGNAKYF